MSRPIIGADDAPIPTLRRGFGRPDPGLVAALSGVPTGYLVDCMDGSGAMHHRIKPLDPPAASVVGVAVTSSNCAPSRHWTVIRGNADPCSQAMP